MSCVVPAAGVIGEAMVALVLAQAMLEKFGGDSLRETKRNYEGYLEQVKNLLNDDLSDREIRRPGARKRRPRPSPSSIRPELHKLVEDMFESMYAAKGVGLAAPQIGICKRIAVIDCSNGERPEEKIVLINPEIIKVEGTQAGEEGCLSIPGFREQVTRGKTGDRAGRRMPRASGSR